MLEITGNHSTALLRHVEELRRTDANSMKKLLWTLFVFIILLTLIGLTSCIQTGDEERPGLRVSADLILTKVWKVTLFEDDGQNKTSLFQDVFLEFRPNLIFKITKQCEIVEGEWILSSDSTLLVIRIPDSQEPLRQLDDEWVITWLTDSEMHIIEQDDKGDEEFHLQVVSLHSLSCQSCDNFINILTDSIWSITMLSGGANDVAEETRGSYLVFEENGEVVLHIEDEEITGSWAITDNCQTLVIQWLEDQILPEQYRRLENTWFIQQNDHQFMAFENEASDGRLQITKGHLPLCEDLLTNMLNTSWFIDYMVINDDDVSDNFIGTGLTFLENNQLATEVVVGPAVLGEWMLTGNCDQLKLDIQAGQLTELSREWIITDFKDEKIILVYEQGTLRMELHLNKGKPQLTAKCIELIEYIVQGEWSVKNYSENEQGDDPLFDGYYFKFKEDGELIIWNSDKKIAGIWYPIRDCGYIVIEIDRNSVMRRMAGEWKIENYRDNGITMVYDKMSTKRKVELIRN